MHHSEFLTRQSAMQKVRYHLRKELRPYVNCVMTDTSTDPTGSMNLPLYADGYPGIMFQQSTNAFYLLPRKKRLSELFLYGQTVHPVSLTVEGTYRFVVLQLYPFASKYLLNVDPKELNDDCYDLRQLQNIDIANYLTQLHDADHVAEHIEIMSDLMEALLAVHSMPTDDRIQNAIDHIIQADGQVRMRDVQEQVSLTERTLERNFLNQVGLTPKQFAKIIQFQSSLERLDAQYNEKLTEVGLESGFSDQSHFIRVFKTYTGLSPSQYRKQAAIRG